MSAHSTPEGAAADGTERAHRPSSRLGKLAWTALIAAVALASSGTALFFEIWPGLRPDPRTDLGGTVSVFAVEPHVSQRAFLQTISFSPAELRRKENAYVVARCGPRPRDRCGKHALSQPGEVVYARTTVRGFKWRSIGIRASIYYANSERRDPQLDNKDVAGERVDAPSDSAVVPIWMPCPENSTRTYFARIELYDSPDDLLLGIADSKHFRASGCTTNSGGTAPLAPG